MGYHGISVSHADNLVTFQHLSTTSQSGSQNVAIADYELANQWHHWQQFHGYKRDTRYRSHIQVAEPHSKPGHLLIISENPTAFSSHATEPAGRDSIMQLS